MLPSDSQLSLLGETCRSTLALPTPQWYLTGGYMDWMGNATAERAFTWTEPRWQYPDLWHTFTVPLAVSGETLQIILVRMDARTHAGNPLPRQGIPHQQAGGAEIFSFTAASGQV